MAVDQLAGFNYGEVLVQAVLTELANSNAPVPVLDIGPKGVIIRNDKNSRSIVQIMNEMMRSEGRSIKFGIDAPIAKIYTNNGRELNANGVHRIDVLASDGESFFPLECKLGRTGGAAIFPKTFEDKWLEVGRLIQHVQPARTKKGVGLTTKARPSIAKGNIIHLLDCSSGLSLKDHKADKQHTGWGLVTRRAALCGLNGKSRTAFKKLKIVLALEDLIGALDPNSWTNIKKYLAAEYVKVLDGMQSGSPPHV